jgi:squalene synthase HpnC
MSREDFHALVRRIGPWLVRAERLLRPRASAVALPPMEYVVGLVCLLLAVVLMPVDHYENFPVASLLLPRRLRRPIEAIYRFARGADDIADEGDASDAIRLQGLAEYGDELDRIERGEPRRPAKPSTELARGHRRMAAAATALPRPARRLCAGCRQEALRDYPQLLDYCRRSANPVGRLLLHLVGRASDENLRRSDCICSALQLINFWQDIAIDWQKDRVYLPQADLAQFGVDESQIAERRCDAEWAALLDFQIERTHAPDAEGAPLVQQLPGRMGWEIRLTVQGGLRILERIAAFAATSSGSARSWAPATGCAWADARCSCRIM